MWGRLKRPSPRHTNIIETCRSDDSDFCRAVVAKGLLSEEQMHRAAERYQLGRSRSGKTIYWLIDERGIVRDGHIGDPWVSVMLQHRFPELAQYIRPRHCLFGLHLLDHTDRDAFKCHTDLTDHTDRNAFKCHTDPTDHTDCAGSAVFKSHTDLTDHTDMNTGSMQVKEQGATESVRSVRSVCNKEQEALESVRSVRSVCESKAICVVERESSAVILSELFPDHVWLAVPASVSFTVDMLEPLRHRKVIVYPSTDDTMSNYVAWLELADMARSLYHLDISVSRLLEDRATEEQKQRKIDLVGFLFEGVGRSKKE